ncbi:heterogeneous nuclear ribonucleoprotein L-like [Rhopilema esculentum]|uniref:heterogeneous nuclear ribonucleoprotein L-like n=1 Tax=Rhopilema esculentum TaxID=499914 RepID=UPI0031E0A41F
MAAERTSESLFLAMPTYDCYDHTKRIRRDSHQLPSIDIANSFSYSSGFELSSPNFASNSFQEKDTNCVDQSTLHSNGSLAKYSRNQAFEAFYSSLKASDLSSYIGFNSILSGNARSIQNAIENHNMPPSRVVHCRAVADGCKETDIVAAMKQFGKIRALTLMPKLRQALIEFETLESATACIKFSKVNPIMVLGRQMYVNFSKSQEINRDFSGSSGTLVETPTNVLLFTIINAIHPINVDVIKKICSNHAEVQRIVIFHKNGLQALVEFGTSEEAQAVKKSLNRRDIYAGCCTLKIDFSKTGRLNVHANTSETFDSAIDNQSQRAILELLSNDRDGNYFAERGISNSSYSSSSYTNGSLGSSSPGPSPSFPIGQASSDPAIEDSVMESIGSRSSTYKAAQNDIIAKAIAKHGSSALNSILSDTGILNSLIDTNNTNNSSSSILGIQPNTNGSAFASFGKSLSLAGGEGCVAMVYGVNLERMNCDKLFNLFCLYGNVVKVKVLTNKVGAAMIQYTDKMSTDIAIRNLNNLTLFVNKFQLSFSKHPFIADASQISRLPDGSPSAVNYADSRNNRFKYIPGGVDIFSRIHPPSKVLHYFNAPADCTEEQLKEVFAAVNAEIPLKQATFAKGQRSVEAVSMLSQGKSSSGLLEFSCVPTAVEALILANHFTMHRDGGGAYTLKLAFSPSSTINN